MATFGKIGATRMLTTSTAKAYIHDGLIAMWDGLENAGYGIHTADTQEVVDLISGTKVYSVSGISQKGWAYSTVPFLLSRLSNKFTIEITLTQTAWRTSNQGSYIWPDPWVDKVCELFEYPIRQHYFQVKLAGASMHNFNIKIPLGLSRLSVSGNGSTVVGYVNDTYANWSFNRSFSSYSNNKFGLGIAGNTGYIHNVRFYNRALSATEIASNYTIDRRRFSAT